MNLNIDTTDKEFVVTQAPQPKLDQNGEPRTDKITGMALWATQMVVTDESGGEIIRVNTIGEPPKIDVGDPVLPQNLVALPWASNGRSGVAYRADAIVEDLP